MEGPVTVSRDLQGSVVMRRVGDGPAQLPGAPARRIGADPQELPGILGPGGHLLQAPFLGVSL